MIQGREYLPGDEVEIVRLLQKVFPHWQTQVDPLTYWRCKYPASKSRTYVSEVDGKLIFSVSYVACRVKIGERSYAASFGDDLVTHPDYRGMGATKSVNGLRDSWEKEIGLVLSYVITTNPIVVESARRTNAKELPYRINHMIRIKDVNQYIKKRKLNPTLLSPGLSLLKTVSNIGAKHIDHKRDFDVAERPFSEAINSFWEKARVQFDFVIEKDLGQLSWRYQHGLGDYVVFQATKGKEILGYIVLENKREGDYVEGFITDLIMLPGRNDVAVALVDEAVKYFNNESVNAIHYRCVNGHPHQELLKSFGFMAPPKAIDMYMILYYKDPRLHEPLINAKPSRLYFSYGDYL